MGNNGFLTAKEVAEEFFEGRVCYKQILAMTRSGELPARKIGKNYIYRCRLLRIGQRWNSGNPHGRAEKND